MGKEKTEFKRLITHFQHAFVKVKIVVLKIAADKVQEGTVCSLSVHSGIMWDDVRRGVTY